MAWSVWISWAHATAPTRAPFLIATVYILDDVVSMVGSNREAIETACNSLHLRLKARTPTVKQKVVLTSGCMDEVHWHDTAAVVLCML